MIRLLLKIFLAYWIVAAIIIVIADSEPHRTIHSPELNDALDSALAIDRTDRSGCLRKRTLSGVAKITLFFA